MVAGLAVAGLLAGLAPPPAAPLALASPPPFATAFFALLATGLLVPLLLAALASFSSALVEAPPPLAVAPARAVLGGGAPVSADIEKKSETAVSRSPPDISMYIWAVSRSVPITACKSEALIFFWGAGGGRS